MKQAIKSEDAKRVRQAADRLKDAATRFSEAVNRGTATRDTSEERSSQDRDVIDAEFEEADKNDRKAG